MGTFRFGKLECDALWCTSIRPQTESALAPHNSIDSDATSRYDYAQVTFIIAITSGKTEFYVLHCY